MNTQQLANVTNLTPSQPARVSLLAAMASKYSMETETFKNVIKQTVMPANATNEQMAAFLLVAHEYDLNPITKEIYAFPAKGGGVTPVVGIDGWVNLAQRRADFDGIEHEWEMDEKGLAVSCTCRVWRKDRTRPVSVTEFMDECKRPTDPWRSHPRRMLRHKATIQAIRYAFGFSGIKDEDDADVIYTQATVIEHATADSKPAKERLMAKAAQQQEQPATAKEYLTDDKPEDAQEWPRSNADGELVDMRGIGWDERIHASSKACNDDGTWRRKRGADTELVARYEAEAIAKKEGQDEAQAEEQEPEPVNRPGDFDKILSGIRASESKEEIDEWFDFSRDCVISQSQRYALDAAVESRLKQIAAD